MKAEDSVAMLALAAGSAAGGAIGRARVDQPEPLRRTPTQRRAQDRIERILDAADQELAATGTLDTRAVAQRASISIGSLYHWFPDKESIALELAVRYWNSLAALIADTVEQVEAVNDPEPVAVIFGALADGFRSRPGFLSLWFGDLRSEQLRSATRPSRDLVAGSIAGLLAADYPHTNGELRARVARIVTLLGDGIMREAFRIARDGDPVVLEEGIHAIKSYIDTRLAARTT